MTGNSNSIETAGMPGLESGSVSGKSAVKDSNTSNKDDKKSDTAFRTISEVAEILDVQQHVLRFWETKFTQVKPLKRGGGRRYYRPEDVEMLKRIHNLLYREKYTIKGVQELLKGQGRKQILASPIGVKPMVKVMEEVVESDQGSAKGQGPEKTIEAATGKEGLTQRQRVILNSMLGDLKDLRDLIRGEDKA